MKIRINYVCIIGASIGLLSVVLTWATVVIDNNNSIHWIGSGYLPPSPDDIPPELLFEVLEVEDWNVIDFVLTTGPSPNSHNSEIQLQIQSYCLIFLIGTLVAFLTPLGGLIQIIAFIGFNITLRAFPAYGDWEFEFGPFIGIFSALAVLSSICFGLWIQYNNKSFTHDMKSVSLLDRLVTIKPIKDIDTK